MTRRRLTTKQREELWQHEAAKAIADGRGEHPICNLCDQPIAPGTDWDDSHDKHKPHWLGGEPDGIAHRRCNRLHNYTHDTPLYARSERIYKRHMDFKRSRFPLPGGRDDPRKRTIGGLVVERATNLPFRKE